MRNATLASALIGATIACPGYAQQRQSVAPEAKVFVGQSLEHAKRALASRQIEFHEGGFAFIKRDPDQSNLIAIIDKSHTYACIFYSKSRSQVPGLDVVFFPAQPHTKPSETWLSATELVVHDDRGYSARFSPPPTDEQLKERQKSRPASRPPS
jgi:hypothetical protein